MINNSKEYECVFCYQSTCLLQSFFVCLLVFLCRSQQPSHDLHRPSDTSAEWPAAWPPRPQTAPAETTQLQRRGGTLTHLHLSVYKYSENGSGVGQDWIRFSISSTPCSIRSYTAACSCWVAAFGPAPPLAGPVTVPPYHLRGFGTNVTQMTTLPHFLLFFIYSFRTRSLCTITRLGCSFSGQPPNT